MPFLQRPSLSTDLLKEIGVAEEMHVFIQKAIPDTFVGDTDRKILIAALFSLVMEHHGAILYLLRAGQYDGSAATLVRPLIDCCYRAHWIHACAKSEIVSRIKQGEDVYPGINNMATEIEKKIDTEGFFPLIAQYIKALHGYTHGGLEQLGRRFNAAGDVISSYTDEEKQEFIKMTTTHFTAFSILWCQIASSDPSDGRAKSKAISDFHLAKYPLP
jgi:hypothetical protein